MSADNKPPVTPTRWDALRRYTDARIALGRAGHSQPTAPHLAFALAHAQARDAVHLAMDAEGVAAQLQTLGLESLLLHSAAPDRATYLQRPDLGRQLDEHSRNTLSSWRQTQGTAAFDLALVLADGLSALAIHQNAAELVSALLSRLRADAAGWSLAPAAIVEQGRVAVGDEIGEGLGARLVVVLIGERPGLSAPDSLGLYFTWAPRPGRHDAERNCISNVRPAGLAIDAAAAKLHQLLAQARARQLTGVDLKDESDDQAAVPGPETAGASFLLAPVTPR